jgi:hypothetical protein
MELRTTAAFLSLFGEVQPLARHVLELALGFRGQAQVGHARHILGLSTYIHGRA